MVSGLNHSDVNAFNWHDLLLHSFDALTAFGHTPRHHSLFGFAVIELNLHHFTGKCSKVSFNSGRVVLVQELNKGDYLVGVCYVLTLLHVISAALLSHITGQLFERGRSNELLRCITRDGQPEVGGPVTFQRQRPHVVCAPDDVKAVRVLLKLSQRRKIRQVGKHERLQLVSGFLIGFNLTLLILGHQDLIPSSQYILHCSIWIAEPDGLGADSHRLVLGWHHNARDGLQLAHQGELGYLPAVLIKQLCGPQDVS